MKIRVDGDVVKVSGENFQEMLDLTKFLGSDIRLGFDTEWNGKDTFTPEVFIPLSPGVKEEKPVEPHYDYAFYTSKETYGYKVGDSIFYKLQGEGIQRGVVKGFRVSNAPIYPGYILIEDPNGREGLISPLEALEEVIPR